MNNYLYLIYQLRINDKLRNVKSFLKFLQKVPDVYLISLFFIVSIFKLVCSVITIVVLDEILSLFSLSFTLPYVIVLLLYLFSMEDHQKNKTLLNKLLPFFVIAPLSRNRFGINLLLLPVLVDLTLKLDVILPFIVFPLISLKFEGMFLVFLVLGAALVRNIAKVGSKIGNNVVKVSIFQIMLKRILGIALGIFVIDRIFYLSLFTFESIKKMWQGASLQRINADFSKQLQELFLNFSGNYLHLISILVVITISLSLVSNVFKVVLYVEQLYSTKINVSMKTESSLADLFLFRKIKFSVIEKMYLDYIEDEKTVLTFLFSMPEIFVGYYLVYLLCSHSPNIWVVSYILVSFFIIENSNIVNAFVIKNQEVFRNYVDILKLYYWKSSRYGIRELYLFKRDLLVKLSRPLVLEQIMLSYIISILVLPQFLGYISLLHLFFFLISNKLTRLNAKLSTMMTPYIFSKNYSILKNMDKTETEYTIYSKLYNFYKFPMTMLTLIPLVIQLFVDIFSLTVFIGTIALFGAYYLYIDREERLLLDKGVKEYGRLQL
ncbi:hypothetical protein [Ligilactobacillus animalis]|jgi:hypothetical protein|uniref:hypothetical protein n=1 Tax=Ligilactobacillus animalis TaxID=1605 RepID=UPI002594281D|nr:hypothetical protein [Ligilactobacillus animalis]